jgi:aryl-alcohol dehydrogenase-like predicted oxidoreductase|tara:strand:- start:432 stop:1406 length:975 start_codon:yes stop_codon:yes gene_type:complete
MKYRQFGNTGIEVSEIGFGAWGIGGTPKDARAYGPTDDKVSQQALMKAFDSGITFYDTSPLYGYGHSEELIGKAFKDVRESIIISSKVGFVNFKGKQDFSPQYTRSSLESSLRRLKTDYIDVFQLHYPPIELLQQDRSIVEYLESLKNDGKIRVVGISTKSPEESQIAIEQFNFKSVQVNFNLVDQRALESGLFKKCEEYGVGIIGRTPLCFGFLTGQYGATDNYDPSDHRSLWSPEQIDRWANAYRLFAGELTEEEEQTNAQIALRFCLSYPVLSTIIPGMLTEAHVEENTKSSNLGSFSCSILEGFNQIYRSNDFFIKQGAS